MHKISPLVKDMEIDEQRPSMITSHAKTEPETHVSDLYQINNVV